MERNEIWYNPTKYPEHRRIVVKAFELILNELNVQDAMFEALEDDPGSTTPEDELRYAKAAGHREKRTNEVYALAQRFIDNKHAELDVRVFKKCSRMFRARALEAAGRLLEISASPVDGPAYKVVENNQGNRENIEQMKCYLNACVALTGFELGFLGGLEYPFDKEDW